MIRVLVVDDSLPTRRWLERVLAAAPGIEVVGTAPDPFVARDLIVRLAPDVLTLDVEMPRMDGLSFLRRLMHYRPMPVVVLSSLTGRAGARALEALEAGAVEVLGKPGLDRPAAEVGDEVVAAVRAAARAKPAPAAAPPAAPAHPAGACAHASGSLLAVGASTGGTVAIEQILRAMPPDGPPTAIVQHLPAGFSAPFAARLDELCAMQVREARDGDALEAGLALIAPGDRHLVVRRRAAGLFVQVKDGPRVNGHRPAVDVLFRSVAETAGRDAVGVVLTGMGEDGARGLLAMREAGAMTVAQDEESCVVWGMPRAAVVLGAAARVVRLDRVAAVVLGSLEARLALPRGAGLGEGGRTREEVEARRKT